MVGFEILETVGLLVTRANAAVAVGPLQPLVWCFTSMLFQMVGSVTVLIGLILLAYSPMVYFVSG